MAYSRKQLARIIRQTHPDAGRRCPPIVAAGARFEVKVPGGGVEIYTARQTPGDCTIGGEKVTVVKSLPAGATRAGVITAYSLMTWAVRTRRATPRAATGPAVITRTVRNADIGRWIAVEYLDRNDARSTVDALVPASLPGLWAGSGVTVHFVRRAGLRGQCQTRPAPPGQGR